MGKTKVDAGAIKVAKGILNCGCTEESALWEFYIWKTWSASSHINGEDVTEPLYKGVPDPRLRLFIIEALQRDGVAMEDFYSGKLEMDPKPARIRVLKNQISRQVRELNKLHGLDKESKTEIFKACYVNVDRKHLAMMDVEYKSDSEKFESSESNSDTEDSERSDEESDGSD